MMETDRCAKLMIVAAVNKLSEVWVSRCPFLLYCYYAQYFPAFFLRCSIRHLHWISLIRVLAVGDANGRRHFSISPGRAGCCFTSFHHVSSRTAYLSQPYLAALWFEKVEYR